MATVEALVEQLRGMAGTPGEMSAALNLEASDRTFRRAVAQLEDEGVLIPQGNSRKRHYLNSTHVPDEIDRALLDVVPCTAREFSERGHSVGLFGTTLGARKELLGIKTYKKGGQWLCRLTEDGERAARRLSLRQARICPKCQRRQFGDLAWTCPEHGVAIDQPDRPYAGVPAQPRPSSEQFARMAATAGSASKTIGGKVKEA